MRVVSHIQELVAELDWTEDDLGRALGIDPRSAQKLIVDSPTWELRKETLHRLLLLGYEHGFQSGVFEVRHHAIWNTFERAPTTLFRMDLACDTRVESAIRDFLGHLECTPTLAVGLQDASKIGELIRTQNCVFIGSPKANHASEIALALLCGAQPFDQSAANRKRFPFQMLGKTARHKDGMSGVLSESTWTGFVFKNSSARGQHRVAVDWLPDDKFKLASKGGTDASAIVVCRKPLQAQVDVTTIVISGYTGLATEQAAVALLKGEPPLAHEQLEDAGKTFTMALTFGFKKRKYRGQRKTSDLKVADTKSFRWMPPWNEG